MALHSGKNCRAVMASTTYRCYQWEGDEYSPEIDGTNSESGGRGEYISGGIVDLRITAQCHWNGETTFTSLTPSGQYSCTFTADTGATLSGTLNVTRCRITSAVRGGVDVYVEGIFSGSVTKTGL